MNVTPPGRRCQRPTRGVASEEQPIVWTAGIRALDEEVQFGLRGARFDLNRRTLAGRRLFQHHVYDRLLSADRGRPMPAAARENDVDERLEILPMERLDRVHHDVEHRVARLDALLNQRLDSPV